MDNINNRANSPSANQMAKRAKTSKAGGPTSPSPSSHSTASHKARNVPKPVVTTNEVTVDRTRSNNSSVQTRAATSSGHQRSPTNALIQSVRTPVINKNDDGEVLEAGENDSGFQEIHQDVVTTMMGMNEPIIVVEENIKAFPANQSKRSRRTGTHPTPPTSSITGITTT